MLGRASDSRIYPTTIDPGLYVDLLFVLLQANTENAAE